MLLCIRAGRAERQPRRVPRCRVPRIYKAVQFFIQTVSELSLTHNCSGENVRFSRWRARVSGTRSSRTLCARGRAVSGSTCVGDAAHAPWSLYGDRFAFLFLCEESLRVNFAPFRRDLEWLSDHARRCVAPLKRRPSFPPTFARALCSTVCVLGEIEGASGFQHASTRELFAQWRFVYGCARGPVRLLAVGRSRGSSDRWHVVDGEESGRTWSARRSAEVRGARRAGAPTQVTPRAQTGRFVWNHALDVRFGCGGLQGECRRGGFVSTVRHAAHRLAEAAL